MKWPIVCIYFFCLWANQLITDELIHNYWMFLGVNFLTLPWSFEKKMVRIDIKIKSCTLCLKKKIVRTVLSHHLIWLTGIAKEIYIFCHRVTCLLVNPDGSTQRIFLIFKFSRIFHTEQLKKEKISYLTTHPCRPGATSVLCRLCYGEERSNFILTFEFFFLQTRD